MKNNYWEERYKKQTLEKTVAPVRWNDAEFKKHTDDTIKTCSNILKGRKIKVDTALDYGCGMSRLKPLVDSVCDTYIGCDMVESALVYNRGVFPGIEYINVDEGIKDLTVGLIWTGFVIQHIMDDSEVQELFQTFYDILEKDGYLIILDCYDQNLEDAIHIKYRRDDLVIGWLEDAGFNNIEIVHEDYFGADGIHSLLIARKQNEKI